MENKICDYGCGQEATHQFKNGKWCCNLSRNKCKTVIEYNRCKNIGRKAWNKGVSHKIESIVKMSFSHRGNKQSKETRFKISNSLKGKIYDKERCENISKSLQKRKLSENHKLNIKIRNKHIKHNNDFKEKQRKRMLNGGAKYASSFVKKESIEKKRQYMLNGGAVHMLSFIQNPSKPQVELYNRVKELYPSAILNYPCNELNYSLDVAIPELKIWFESDGSYWHQDKEKDLIRQKKIESLGWKCIRYKADFINEVPKLEQLEKDIGEKNK